MGRREFPCVCILSGKYLNHFTQSGFSTKQKEKKIKFSSSEILNKPVIHTGTLFGDVFNYIPACFLCHNLNYVLGAADTNVVSVEAHDAVVVFWCHHLRTFGKCLGVFLVNGILSIVIPEYCRHIQTFAFVHACEAIPFWKQTHTDEWNKRKELRESLYLHT